MNRGLLFALLFFALALLLLHWPPQARRGSSGDAATAEIPAYAASQIVIRRFGDDGKPQLRLDASRVAHYRSNGRTLLDQPRFASSSPNQQWHGQAVEGELVGNHQLLLSKDVVITAQAAHNRPQTTVETATLDVDLANNRAVTADAVTIRNNQLTMRGTGLDADLNAERIVIQHQVRTIYDPPR
ncbi:MAG: LPS export ABC transporter periplasmic protein LptC [Corallincola sp.]|nr:LPS export ABC transporter periplasmic protein LptC [Corallincola sp.]